MLDIFLPLGLEITEVHACQQTLRILVSAQGLDYHASTTGLRY